MKAKFSNLLLPLITVIISSGCTKEDPSATDNSGAFKDKRDNEIYEWVRIGRQI